MYSHSPDGKSAFLAEAVVDGGNGTYVIVPDADAEVQNKLKYSCMVSRVGVTDNRVNFTVIGNVTLLNVLNLS